MKKFKCRICGTRFLPDKDALYLATERVAPLSALVSSAAKTFECVDCPKCGCQNAVNVRISADVDPADKEVADNGE